MGRAGSVIKSSEGTACCRNRRGSWLDHLDNLPAGVPGNTLELMGKAQLEVGGDLRDQLDTHPERLAAGMSRLRP